MKTDMNENATRALLEKMLNEAALAAKRRLDESASLDSSDEQATKNAIAAAERISKDEKKLNKFIQDNGGRIEKALAKMKDQEDKKWYAMAWDIVKKAASLGAKFIKDHWLGILQLLVTLAVGYMAGKLFFGAADAVKDAAKWVVKDAADLSVQKLTQTNGLGDFFDPGAAF